jgi:hypothetical protein
MTLSDDSCFRVNVPILYSADAERVSASATQLEADRNGGKLLRLAAVKAMHYYEETKQQ